MSTSIRKCSNKRLFKNKSNYLMITPLFSNQATANSTNKNTIINSKNENINILENKKNSPFSILKIDNKIINFKTKNNINKNSPKGRNSPLNNITKNNKSKTNEFSYNKNRYNIDIHKSIGLNSYSPKNKNIQNNIKRENKNIYFLDKILSNKFSQSSRNISKLKNNHNFYSKETKLSLSKKKGKKDIQDNSLVNNNKSNKKTEININKLNYDNNNKKHNNKIISRNYFLKVSSSMKIKNTNNIDTNKKLITNSINNSKFDYFYFKKKLDDSSRYAKIINQKYNMNNFCNNKSTHNILANLLLNNEKYNKNNNIKLYNLANKKSLKNLEINHKSSLFSKNSEMLSFNSNLNDKISNKNNIPKPINIKNNIISCQKFRKKVQYRKIGLNSQIIQNNSKIKYKKPKEKNNNIGNNKGLNKTNSFKNNFIGKLTEKSQNKNNKNAEEVNQKKKSKTSDNSKILGKDSYLDYLIDTLTKSKNKKGNIEKLINEIKINNYIIKKPKEENMKFTLLKNKNNENEDGSPEINKSKIIIGDIEGYKDIIERDKNNYYKSEKENTIKIFEHNSIGNINDESKKINKKLFLNLNNNDLEISNLNNNNFNNNCFINDSEIKIFLNCMSDEYEFEDLSTTILKKYKKIENYLLPYHVNKISFIKTYDEK